MAKKQYSSELCKELALAAGDPKLEIVHRPVRYENGTVLPVDITGVFPAISGKAELTDAQHLGAGSAVQVFGCNPWTSPVKVRSALGFMSDDMPLFALRIKQLLKLVSGYYPTWDRDLVEQLIDRFKLDPNQKVQKLSKGQGTRIRLLLAMAFKPRVLLLDEPASGLDLAGRHSLLESVLEVVRDPARSVVISSHLLQDVERISDRLLVLNQGAVVKEGLTSELVGDERTLEEAIMVWGAAG